MNPTLVMLGLAAGLFLGMLLSMEVGRFFGRRSRLAGTGDARAGSAAVEGAVFALLGLLIAFTFSGAGSRFEARRHLVVEEANDIGTAYLRLDLLPAASQPPLRELFRKYLGSRLEIYRKLPDLRAAEAELAHSQELQREIWSQAVAAAQAAPTTAPGMLLLPALNQMIDITTTRTMATRMHPPIVVFIMLFLLALACALLAGYGSAESERRNWLAMLAFSAVITITVYVILDIEYPRLGLIRVEAVDQVLVELRDGMK